MWTRKQLFAKTKPQLIGIVLDLQARVAQNSQNSSRPPSSDGYTKPAPKSLREKTGRNTGGQNGHPGHTLQPVEKPDNTVPHRLTICPCSCGKDLSRLPLVRHERRQVFDLPVIRFFVTEHQAEVKLCPTTGREVMAAFPDGVNAPAQYGSVFRGWLSYWRHQQLLPLDRIAQMCQDLFGRSISEATIQAVEAELHRILTPFETHVKTLLRQAPLAHFDETGMRVKGRLHWLHCACTAALTWYGVHAKRGRKAINEFDILPRFHGRAIHDGLESYFLYSCAHGLCNAHHCRELVFIEEVLRRAWARKLRRLLLRMLKAVRAARPKTLAPRRLAALLRQYRAILAQGFKRHPFQAPTPGRRGRPRQSKAYNLLRRLRDHESSVLAFLFDPSVPFTNNQAEQDLRMMKVRQKISGAFRTFDGARRFALIRGYISTARKNHQNIIEALSNAIDGRPFMPRAPT